MTIDTRTKEILSNIEILDGNKTRITETLTPKEYKKVNEVLETLGGKWSRKDKAHTWTCSPDKALKMFISNGDTETASSIETVKDRKDKFQFFATPVALADQLVQAAEFCFPYCPPASVLEPSAGQGALVQAVHRKWPNVVVDCCELMPENRTELLNIKGCRIIAEDFLLAYVKQKYDLVLANPPFKAHADIHHVQKMWECVAPGGALISITSNHWKFASHKVDEEFRQWIEQVDAEVTNIEPGSFKESGTAIAANFLVIRK
jgi:predicted RNA methylase